jgi:natural resistance-associated macrophage protein
MSLAYLDPGNLEADLGQGAQTGYSLMWILLLASIIGLMLQEVSSRLAVVTGRDLAQHVRREYPLWMNYIIYVMMELAVIGADIQEVVGTAIAFNILFRLPIWCGCILTAADSFLFMMVHRCGIRYLECFITILVIIMCIFFAVNWGTSHTDAEALWRGWLPNKFWEGGANGYMFQQFSGIFGAVIMPHNFYLHSGLVLSRRINRQSNTRVKEAISYNAIEATLAIAVSVVINLFMVGVNANLFYDKSCSLSTDADGNFGAACVPLGMSVKDEDLIGPCNVNGAAGQCTSDFSLASESFALAASNLGASAKYIWAIGLLAAGEASTMTCTYAGQVVMGGMIEINLPAWKRVTITRLIALVPSLVFALLLCEDACNNKLYSNLNDFLNTWQNIQLPWAMFPLLYFGSRTEVLGRWRSGPVYLGVTWFLCAIVVAINIYAIYGWLPILSADGNQPWWAWVIYIILWGGMAVLMLCPSLIKKRVAEPVS